MFGLNKIIWLMLLFLPLDSGESLSQNPMENISAQKEQPQESDPLPEESVALEQARILETVDRDYEKALEAYKTLADKKPEPRFLEEAELGVVRCLLKLGQYDAALKHLEGFMKQDLSEASLGAAKNLLQSIERLQTRTGSKPSSTVDNLVWQLLDAASGVDETRALSAATEISKMGALAIPVLKEAAREKEYFRSVTAFSLLVRISGADVLAFLEGCTQDPDPALRKRCLDGLIKVRSVKESFFPRETLLILNRFFLDEQDALKLAALDCFLRYISSKGSPYLNLPKDIQVPLAKSLLELCTQSSGEVVHKAIECARRMVSLGRHNPMDAMPITPLSLIVKQVLDQSWPLREFTSEEVEDLYYAVTMAWTLGSKFNQEPLLEQASQFWAFEDLYTYHKAGEGRYRVMDLALNAGSLLPLEKKIELIQAMVEENHLVALSSFGKICPIEVFLSLPQETLHQYFRAWAGQETYGGEQWARNRAQDNIRKFYQQKDWDPSTWNLLVESTLDNPNEDFRRQALSKIETYTIPDYPESMGALSKWVSHPHESTRDRGLSKIDRLIQEERIDPGPQGALKLVDLAIQAISEPLEIQRQWQNSKYKFEVSRKGEFPFIHRGVNSDLLWIQSCMLRSLSRLNLTSFQDWIWSHEPFPFLKILVTHDHVMKELIRRDPGFIHKVWPQVETRAKEALFEAVYGSIQWGPRYDKNDWLKPMVIPLLKDWDMDPEWLDHNLVRLSQVLHLIHDPSLSDVVKEVVLSFLNKPKMYLKHNEVGEMVNLLKTMDPGFEEGLDLIPAWFEKIPPKIIEQYGLPFKGMVFASPKNLDQTLTWLAEEHTSFFKKKLIELIFDEDENHPRFTENLDLNTKISRIWSHMEKEIQEDLLIHLVKNESAFNSCLEFMIHLLSDPEAEPIHRHLAFAVLMVSDHEGSIEPVLSYLKSLEPGQGDTSLVLPEPPHPEISQIIEFRLEHFPYLVPSLSLLDPYRDAREGGKITNLYPSPTLQPLFKGILSLGKRHPMLFEKAALHLQVESDSDLALAIATYQEPVNQDPESKLRNRDVRLHLFEEILSYLLRENKVPDGRDPEKFDKKPPVPEKALHMLTEALTRDPAYKWTHDFQKDALDMIGKHRIEDLLPRVGDIALHDPDLGVRERAVTCLGNFQTLKTVPFLLECMNDSKEKIRSHAKTILIRLREYEEEKRAWESLLGEEKVQGRPGKPGEALILMLESEDPEIRLAAIQSLGKAGDATTLPLLVQIMAEGTPQEREAAKAAIHAITGK